MLSRLRHKTKTKHAYFPAAFIPDKGSAMVSQVIKEIADALVITQEHATTAHAERIRLLEITHASIKKAINIATRIDLADNRC